MYILLPVALIMIIYGDYKQNKEEKENTDKLKLQLKEELDKLSITEIEDKIKRWKEKGYSVNEIDEMENKSYAV